jgi:hypothetical protein
MVSLIFPSLKDKIKIFQDDSKKKADQKASSSSMAVRNHDLEQIVEQETRKRNPNDYWNI